MPSTRRVRKDRLVALEGFATGNRNCPVGKAQPVVMEKVWRWLTARYPTNIALAKDLASKLGRESLDRTFLSHVRRGKAALPVEQIPAWIAAFAGEDEPKQKALRQLLAIAITHEAVLELFDWKAEVDRLAKILIDGKKHWPISGCYGRTGG